MKRLLILLVALAGCHRGPSAEQLAQDEREREAHNVEYRALLEVNSRLKVGDVLCWKLTGVREWGGNLTRRSTVRGIQREDGKVRFVRFKDTVFVGGREHGELGGDEGRISLHPGDFEQADCPVVEIEGER
jgi:hypothetical protein